MTDEELAQQLVREGWYSTSNKYKLVCRWREPLPKIEDVIRPEMLNAPHVDRMIALWNRQLGRELDLRSSHPLVESRTLTEPQFQAFRKAGGQSA